LAFVFDTRRVRPSGLACELVIPEEEGDGIPANLFQHQFARTPYAASFVAGKQTFILVTLHVFYGTAPSERLLELEAFARWMQEWAVEEEEWGHNLIALGDFNVDRFGDPLFEALTSTGLSIPDELKNLPRTIYSVPGEPDTHKFYDQIAWFENLPGVPSLNLGFRRAGHFDFLPHLFPDLAKGDVEWKISDHFPLWVEFRV
jgi:endonuclease/exonuclease/phosphatase family metal-dependent hydrolase